MPAIPQDVYDNTYQTWASDPTLRETYPNPQTFIDQVAGQYYDDTSNPSTRTGAGTGTGTPLNPTTNDALDLSGLLKNNTWSNDAPGALDAGVYNAMTDKSKQNTNSVQGSSQNGAFASTGSTNQTQSQTQNQTSDQTNNQHQTQSQTGTTDSTSSQNSLNQSLGQSIELGNTNQSTVNSSNSQGQSSNISNNQSNSLGQTTNNTTNSTAGLSTNATNGLTSNQSSQQGSEQSSNLGTTNSRDVGQQSVSGSDSGLQSSNTSNITQTGVNDTLGLGSLIKQQAQNAQASDAARNAWLTDVMQNGGTGYQEQMQQAINNSLSGPGMQGVGNMAKGRVAGSAAEQIAMNNMDQRLQAAQQLQSGGQFSNIAALGDNYLGSTQSQVGSGLVSTNNTNNSTTNTLNNNSSSTANTGRTLSANQSSQLGASQNQSINQDSNTSFGSSTGTTANSSNDRSSSIGNTSNTSNAVGNNNTTTNNSSAQSNTSAGNTTGANSSTSSNSSVSDALNTLKQNSSSLGLSSLISNESQKGVSGANSLQAATGQIPQTQQSGGGCYVCTAYVGQGRMNRNDVLDAAWYKLQHLDTYGRSLHGYSIYGPALAKLVYRDGLFAQAFFPFANAILEHELWLAGRKKKTNLFSRICHGIFNQGSKPFSYVAAFFGHRKITTPPKSWKALQDQQLNFNFNYEV